MRYLKLFENFQDIDSLCEEYRIRDYTIRSDGSVDVDDDVALYSKRLESLPIKFSIVGGYFNCSGNELTSLEGCPKEVSGYFDCSENKLTSLEGCPKKIGFNFNCSHNRLTIIDCLPEWVEGDIYFYTNQIRYIKVEDNNYKFFGKCYLEENPINDLFKYWKGDLREFIEEIQFEDFIRDNGESVDITRFEYALNGKKYNKEDIKKNYNLIWK